MYQGTVPRITHQFPQSMFARERDGYLRDRAPCDDEDDEDIEAVTAEQDKQRYSRSSRRDDDEDFEPVKTHQVRPRANRSSHLEDEGEFETVRSATRPRYSAASLLDDDGDAEPVMKLEVSLVYHYIFSCSPNVYFVYVIRTLKKIYANCVRQLPLRLTVSQQSQTPSRLLGN